MAKAAKACIFCGHRKVSKEHVWSQWIAKAMIEAGSGLPGFSWTVEREESPGGPRTVVGKGDGNLITVKARCVCRGCNMGWMSDLEQECKPLLLAMIFGEGVHLSMSDRSTVAAWCAVKAMAYEYVLWTVDRTIPRDAHSWLYKNRDHPLPPPQMSVWLAAYRGDSQEAGLAWHKRGNSHANGRTLGQIYWLTILVGHLVFQVAGFRPSQNWQIEHPGEARCGFMRLWPIDGIGSKKWPPARILTDSTIHRVAEIEPELFITGRFSELPASE
jgi:hypothetical protein